MEGTSAHMRHVVESSMESYVCRNRDHGNNGMRTYNELATIMHVTGEDAVRWGAALHSLALRRHKTQG